MRNKRKKETEIKENMWRKTGSCILFESHPDFKNISEATHETLLKVHRVNALVLMTTQRMEKPTFRLTHISFCHKLCRATNVRLSYEFTSWLSIGARWSSHSWLLPDEFRNNSLAYAKIPRAARHFFFIPFEIIQDIVVISHDFCDLPHSPMT